MTCLLVTVRCHRPAHHNRPLHGKYTAMVPFNFTHAVLGSLVIPTL